jgi:hypothetical protein
MAYIHPAVAGGRNCKVLERLKGSCNEEAQREGAGTSPRDERWPHRAVSTGLGHQGQNQGRFNVDLKRMDGQVHSAGELCSGVGTPWTGEAQDRKTVAGELRRVKLGLDSGSP